MAVQSISPDALIEGIEYEIRFGGAPVGKGRVLKNGDLEGRITAPNLILALEGKSIDVTPVLEEGEGIYLEMSVSEDVSRETDSLVDGSEIDLEPPC